MRVLLNELYMAVWVPKDQQQLTFGGEAFGS